MQLTDIDDTFEFARYYSPQLIADLTVTEREGHHEVEIPKLVEWGFVVFAPSESHFEDEGNPSDTEAAVEKATNSIDEAREEGRDRSIDYAIAEEKLRAAKVALDYDVHSLAKRMADEALSQGIEAFGRPVIAFDHAHVRPETLGKNVVGIEQYEERYPGYVFKAITQWGETALSDVDVLVIPPALTFENQRYGFTPQEVDQIEAFVANGGSILVLGSGGMASDIDTLTDSLDFRFLKQNIVDEEEKRVFAETTDCNNDMTSGLDTFEMTHGTAIETLPDQGKVLARIPDDSTAWVRGNEEKSAAGLPVFTLHEHGAGLVTALGHRSFHYWRNNFDDDHPLVENSLSMLGRHAQQSRNEDQRASTDSPSESNESATTRTTAPQETGTTTSQPGFGAGIALAAITIGGLLSKWLRGGEQ